MTETVQTIDEQTVRGLDEEEQLVIFQLGGEDYGVDIYSVQRLIQVPEITAVPRAPAFIAGVIDVRGDVIPVVNLKKRFGFANTDVGEKGRIVIIEIGNQIVGFLVDGVSEVTRLAAGDIEPPAAIVVGTGTDFIAGIGKQMQQHGNRLIIVLDAEKVLTHQEHSELATLGQQLNETAPEEPATQVAEYSAPDAEPEPGGAEEHESHEEHEAAEGGEQSGEDSWQAA